MGHVGRPLSRPLLLLSLSFRECFLCLLLLAGGFVQIKVLNDLQQGGLGIFSGEAVIAIDHLDEVLSELVKGRHISIRPASSTTKALAGSRMSDEVAP